MKLNAPLEYVSNLQQELVFLVKLWKADNESWD